MPDAAILLRINLGNPSRLIVELDLDFWPLSVAVNGDYGHPAPPLAPTQSDQRRFENL